ncbi:unnamed protein product [Soboliphyme baturini]|uniref:Inner membrane protein n=1 Tax=Soboliphyme baturini TaxID=241478 RepID=A0A183IKC5_9BILA|nr:unnamed protein product [Soboliphyme baturini]
MDIGASSLFVLLYLVAWVLSCYDCVMQFENNTGHHQYSFPDGSLFIHWQNRLLAVCVICAINAVLYVASVIVARKQ